MQDTFLYNLFDYSLTKCCCKNKLMIQKFLDDFVSENESKHDSFHGFQDLEELLLPDAIEELLIPEKCNIPNDEGGNDDYVKFGQIYLFLK